MLHLLTAGTEGSGGLGMLLTMGAVFVLLYFMMIRPENKRKKEAEAMRAAVKKGDSITTIGGVVGIVVDVNDERVVVETGADRVRVEFAKWAISTNETAAADAEDAAKKAREDKAKAKAAKKAEKNTR